MKIHKSHRVVVGCVLVIFTTLYLYTKIIDIFHVNDIYAMDHEGKYPSGNTTHHTIEVLYSESGLSSFQNNGISGDNIMLRQVKLYPDIWIFSLHYMLPDTEHPTPYLRGIALGPNVKKSKLTTVKDTPIFHMYLPYQDEVKVKLGSLRDVGPPVGNPWRGDRGEQFLEVDLDPHYKPVKVAFSWPGNETLTEAYPVTYPDTSTRREISVCYSVIFSLEDTYRKLQQNIEYNILMGVEHFFIYVQRSDLELDKLLRYYIMSAGVLTVLTMPDHFVVNESMYFGQRIAINDCHTRNRYTSSLLSIQDWDEYIFPVKHGGWVEMIREIDRNNNKTRKDKQVGPSSYEFQHTCFSSEAMNTAEWSHVVNSLRLSVQEKKFTIDNNVSLLLYNIHEKPLAFPKQVKNIIRPERVLRPGVHYPAKTVAGTYKVLVNPKLGYLRHLRGQCIHGGGEKWGFSFQYHPLFNKFLSNLSRAQKQLQSSYVVL